MTQYLAEELDLAVPVLPWHTERDRIAEAATALGIVAGAMAKIAADVVLLAQTEVGEAGGVRRRPARQILRPAPETQSGRRRHGAGRLASGHR